MLFKRRQRLKDLDELDRKGEGIWSSEFAPNARVRIVHALRDSAGEDLADVADYARNLILRDEGLFSLNGKADETHDLITFIMEGSSDDVSTAVEAICRALKECKPYYRSWIDPRRLESFAQETRVILREHRVSFDLVGTQMVSFESREMHRSVVRPSLILLGGNSKFASAERAYLEALDQISEGNPGNAITDAGTALQETLMSLGCEGNALGPLIKSAKAKGLIAPHDTPLMNSIERAMHWASADRSEKGDAHLVDKSHVSDAWLMVHIVGALILRLADETARS